MINRWVVSLVLCGLSTGGCALASNGAPPENQPRVLFLEGSISRTMERSVRQVLRGLGGEAFPAPLIVLLDSPGGDGMAAMAIGKMLRQAKAHVFVTGQCASACVFILAAGVVRTADAYSVGLHRGRVTISDADGKVQKELTPEQGSDAQKFLKRFEQEAAKYLTDMGIAPALFETMQKFERRSVYRLNTKEMVAFRLDGIDPEYLTQMMSKGLRLSTGRLLTPDELQRRIQRVPSYCGTYERQNTAFVECYRQSLTSPY